MVQKEKILVVDDDEDIREFIFLYLKKEGYNVALASNAGEALQLVKEIVPDLVILDIFLPDMNGLEICREIRKGRYFPVLFLSCKGEERDIIQGLGAGGDDYMTKPISPGELVARVKTHLRRRVYWQTDPGMM